MKYEPEQTEQIFNELVTNNEHIVDWSIGWRFPRISTLEDVIDFIDTLGNLVHLDWRVAVSLKETSNTGDSPSEPFRQATKVLENLKEGK